MTGDAKRQQHVRSYVRRTPAPTVIPMKQNPASGVFEPETRLVSTRPKLGRQVHGEVGEVRPGRRDVVKKIKAALRSKKEQIRKARLEIRQVKSEEAALLAEKNSELRSRVIEYNDLRQKLREARRGIPSSED